MADIRLINLTKKFGEFTAVDNVDLRVRDGEYVTLLGPSGCGKTTLLQMIAGLITPSSGDILIDGQSVIKTPPEDRNIGYLFQNYSLFPHMNVKENVRYGPMMMGASEAESGMISDKMLKLVKLLERANFMPATLSGGMQQRVALIRALAAETKIIFLDEPLSTLDPKVGIILRYEIHKMAKKLGLTIVHVTHDQQDAMSISDKVVVMRKGRVIQVGTPKDVYFKPDTPYVAHFLGESNFIKARVSGENEVDFNGNRVRTSSKVEGENVVLAVRPEKILFENRLENTFEGVVGKVNFMGSVTRYSVGVGGVVFNVETAKHPELKEGDTVRVYLPPNELMLFKDFDLEKELRII